MGALLINGVPAETGDALRPGGHILAGMWIVTASLLATAALVRIIGVLGGAWLGSTPSSRPSCTAPRSHPRAS
jgi:hypothetical protein